MREQRQRLPVDEVLKAMRQIAGALDYAHAKGFIHRDLKPSNILLDENGRYVLTDFGIVAAQDARTKLTMGAGALGTPEYMSPEQAQGKPVDARSDIYSLGIVLYELLAGAPPFTADTPWGVVYKHVKEPPPSITQARPDLPPAVKHIVARTLAKDPKDRFQTAAQMVAAIDDVIGQSTAYRKRNTSRVFAVLIGIFALVAVGAFAFAAFALLGRNNSNTSPPVTTTPERTAIAVLASVEVSSTATTGITNTEVVAPVVAQDTPAPPSPTAAPVEPTSSPTVESSPTPAETPTANPSPTVAVVPSIEPATAAPTPTPIIIIVTATPLPVANPPQPAQRAQPAQPAPTSAPPQPQPPAQSPASGSAGSAPKPGQLFNFEGQVNWRRGNQPYGTLARATEQIHDGRASAKLAYNFAAVPDNFVVFESPVKLSGQPTGISAWVHGDGSGHFLNVWLQDGSGQVRQYSFGRIFHSGWRQMVAWFYEDARAWPNNSHISGPDTGKLAPPYTFKSIVLDGVPDGGASSGEIYIDEVYLLTQPLPASASSSSEQASQPASPDATAIATPTPESPYAQVNLLIDGGRGGYEVWGKPLPNNACEASDALGQGQRFSAVLIIINGSPSDLADLNIAFVGDGGLRFVACGLVPSVRPGTTARTSLYTFPLTPVRQVIVTDSKGEVVGRQCFDDAAVARPC